MLRPAHATADWELQPTEDPAVCPARLAAPRTPPAPPLAACLPHTIPTDRARLLTPLSSLL